MNMVRNYITTKKEMKQVWDTAGKRLAVTVVKADPLVVVQVKSSETDGYNAVKVGIGSQRASRLPKSLTKHYEKINLKVFPRRTKELTPNEGSSFEIGSMIAQPFVVGDIVNAQGVTKGRGFAGAIKRWGFHGGPKTHGQSDRHRAVGSIGQGTSPGRVHKGKKMPGHYGVDNKTIRNLTVVHIDDSQAEIWLSGPVPGVANGQVMLTKIGHNDSFPGLSGMKVAETATETMPETVVEDVPVKDEN